MGLFSFAKGIGKSIFGSDAEAAEKIEEHIQEDNPGVDDLKVTYKDGVAKVSGATSDPSAAEKAILMAGNAKGVETVDASELQGLDAASATAYYDIAKGDTLWAIAQSHYGNGAHYTHIVEANQEVIKNADLIFPGQRIRLPELES